MKLSKLLSLVILVLSVCMGTQSCKSVALEDLAGKWSLKTLNGQEAGVAFEDKVPFMDFNIASSTVSGYGGCNRFSGSFEYEKGKLSAPRLATTMMMCAHENKESEFLAVFNEASKLSLTKEGNLVFNQKGKDVFVLERTTGVDLADLTGKWTLNVMTGSEISELFNEKNIPTIEFKDGRVGGNAGCNNYNGQYSLENDLVKIGPLVSTRMACDNLDGEMRLLKLLEGESRLVIDGDSLLFIKGDIVVLSFKK